MMGGSSSMAMVVLEGSQEEREVDLSLCQPQNIDKEHAEVSCAPECADETHDSTVGAGPPCLQ